MVISATSDAVIFLSIAASFENRQARHRITRQKKAAYHLPACHLPRIAVNAIKSGKKITIGFR